MAKKDGLLYQQEQVSGLLGDPSQGGLNATNYPNQWGLRAYKDGIGYGGEMMPKYTGWLGVLANTAHPGDVSTEISVGDNYGEFPSMSPSLNADQIKRLLAVKEGQKIPRDIVNTAKGDADKRRALGLSPFKDVWDE